MTVYPDGSCPDCGDKACIHEMRWGLTCLNCGRVLDETRTVAERDVGLDRRELTCLNCGRVLDETRTVAERDVGLDRRELLPDGGLESPDSGPHRTLSDGGQLHREPDLPAFVERDPRVLLREARIERSLDEVLDAIDQYRDPLQITVRIGAKSVRQTRPLLCELGLMETPTDDILDDPLLDQRLAILRRYAAEEREARP